MSYTLSEIQSVIAKTTNEIRRLEWEINRFQFLIAKVIPNNVEDYLNLEYIKGELKTMQKHRIVLGNKQRKNKQIARNIVLEARRKPIDEARARIAKTTTASKKGYFKMRDVVSVYVVFEIGEGFLCIEQSTYGATGDKNNLHAKSVFVDAFNQHIKNGVWKFVD